MANNKTKQIQVLSPDGFTIDMNVESYGFGLGEVAEPEAK